MRPSWHRLALSSLLLIGCPSGGGGGDDDDNGDELEWEGGPVTCEPNDVDCIGGIAWTCNEDGDRYAEGRDCLGAGLGCIETEGCGRCLDGVSVCDDDTPWVCSGGEMQRQEACAAPTVCNFGRCEDLCEGSASRRSYEGCEYFAVDLPNAFVESPEIATSPRDSQFAVVVSNGDSVSAANVTVYTDRGDGEEEVETATIAPRQVHVFELGPQNVDGTGTDGRAFRVRSSRPVTAYQFNPLNNSEEAFSNDASLLIPTTALDTEYLAVTGDAIVGSSNPEEGTEANWGAFVAVVGIGDAPVSVTVTPSADVEAGGGLDAGRGPFSATLARYEILNLESAGENPPVAGFGNLSGTRVTADGPVAVFAGNVATLVPSGAGATCCADHLEEQMFPLSSWGTSFVAGPSQSRTFEGDRQDDVWRLTAGADPVTLTWIPQPPAGAPGSLGAYESVEFSSGRPFAVVGDRKILLAQFLTSSDQVIGPAACDPYAGGDDCPFASSVCAPLAEGADVGKCWVLCEPNGGASDCPFLATCEPIPEDDEGRGVCQAESDPSMILVPPVEQFRSDYVFLTPDDYEHDYLTVLAPSGTSIHFDGTEVTDLDDVGDVDGTTYASGTVEIPTDGTHIVTASAPVGLLVYGYDRYVSYGYPAGLDLEEIGFE